MPPNGNGRETLHLVGILIGQAVLWFAGLQAAMLAIGLLISFRESAGIFPIHYRGLLGSALWEYLVPVWQILCIISHGAITWFIFRSRWRFIPTAASWFRWSLGIALFAGLFTACFNLPPDWVPSGLDPMFPPIVSKIATLNLAGEFSEGFVNFEICLGLVGALASSIVFLEPSSQIKILGFPALGIALIFGCGKALGIARDWRASPSDEENAIYLAIAQRDFKKFGVPTKLAPDCSSRSDLNALGRDSSLLHLFALLRAEDAFIDMRQRLKRGCKLERGFGPSSVISVLPEGDLTEKMSHDLRGALSDLASDPKQDGIGIFSRVGFSHDRKRAFVYRIGLRRYIIKGDASVTISEWPTILTKTESGWGVDFGSEPDEWQFLRNKTADSERMAFIEEVRSKRGLLSKE